MIWFWPVSSQRATRITRQLRHNPTNYPDDLRNLQVHRPVEFRDPALFDSCLHEGFAEVLRLNRYAATTTRPER
jgi:hypothetical protein